MDETKKTHIVRHLRLMWLQSNERSQALKNANYSCQSCGVKQSKKKDHIQKIEVHHKEGIGNWDKVIELIRSEILCSPDQLMVLCPDCHDRIERYGIQEV
jgi:predicted HNH restriction endonuclease